MPATKRRLRLLGADKIAPWGHQGSMLEDATDSRIVECLLRTRGEAHLTAGWGRPESVHTSSAGLRDRRTASSLGDHDRDTVSVALPEDLALRGPGMGYMVRQAVELRASNSRILIEEQSE